MNNVRNIKQTMTLGLLESRPSHRAEFGVDDNHHSDEGEEGWREQNSRIGVGAVVPAHGFHDVGAIGDDAHLLRNFALAVWEETIVGLSIRSSRQLSSGYMSAEGLIVNVGKPYRSCKFDYPSNVFPL